MRALVIAVSDFHAGYLGCYGNDWLDTPVLDQLAADGVVFDQHYADRPESCGAWHAWRFGRYDLPPADEPPGGLPDAGPDLFALLADHGVGVALILDERFPAPAGLNADGERIRLVRAPGPDPPPTTVHALQEVLGQFAGRDRWLAWLGLSTLSPPWSVSGDDEPLPTDQPTSPLDIRDIENIRRLQDAYARAVHHIDFGLGHLLEGLEARGVRDDLLVVVTSDRGMALGEHGITGAAHAGLHDELIHVPLVVRLPGRAEAGRRVLALSQSVDLPPTLLDSFGVPVPPTMHGRTLWPLLRGEADQVRPYACAGLRVGEAVEWALRTPEWSFLLPVRSPAGATARGRQLYVKPEDRWEVNNVLQHHLELADHFEHTLHDFVQAAREPGPLRAPVLRDVEEPSPSEGDEKP